MLQQTPIKGARSNQQGVNQVSHCCVGLCTESILPCTFQKDVYGGSNAYLGQTNVSIVPNGGHVTNNQGEYDGFKYPHLQLRNIMFDERRSKGNKFDRILDGITMETRGGDLLAIMATKRK